MMDVCNGGVALKMSQLGGLGIIHRFLSIEDQVAEYLKAPLSGCAIGVNGDSSDRLISLYHNGCRIFCIDVANGASTLVKEAIEEISKHYPDISLIVGNVASKETYKWLEQFALVRAIRVGIAGGNACTTKNATGVYHPMASCINECSQAKTRTLLIADGGITEPSDFCKSIALGADIVMLGSTIASTKDSPAKIMNISGKRYKVYHGSASFDIQKTYRDQPKYVEGTQRLLDYNHETLDHLINRFMNGLKSSMSYFNSKTIEEYQINT
jgi:IMP dehydrogenase